MNLPDAGSTLLWSALTVAAFLLARAIFLRTRFPLFHPSALGLVLIVLLIELTGHPYPDYRRQTAWLSWLLGPAVVAMAVPIYRLRILLWRQRTALATTVVAGLIFGFMSMAVLLWAFRAPTAIIEAGTLKSITSPVAYGIAREAHARTDVAIIGVLFAGILGSTLGPIILSRVLGVHDPRAVGLALGCGSHGIGAARALELHAQSGAFASLGMSTTAILGAVVFPYLLRWIFG
jgi:putative effector of murein hydrolase